MAKKKSAEQQFMEANGLTKQQWEAIEQRFSGLGTGLKGINFLDDNGKKITAEEAHKQAVKRNTTKKKTAKKKGGK